jgi:NitT/TauT family transport system permease protein
MLLEFLRAVPPLILVPLALTLLPPMALTEVLIIGVYAALAQFTYSVEASKNVPVHFLDLAQVMGARGTRLTIDVLVPATLPELLGAMRVTVVTSMGIAVVVEYVAMPAGIGRVMNFAASFSRIDLIIVGIMWAAVITLVVDAALNLVSRWCLRWNRSSLRSE